MSLNTFKIEMQRSKVDWIDFSCHLSLLSKSLQTNKKKDIENELIYCIKQNINIANTYNINLDKAWQKWNKKAKSKVYY